MKTVSFYHGETGLFNSATLTVSDENLIACNTPVDHVAIEGAYDHLSTRVDVSTGHVIDYQPPQPSPDHEWDDTTKRWQLTAAAADRIESKFKASARILALEASQHRAIREILLGRLGGSARLQAIDDEIASLRPVAFGAAQK